MKYYIHTRRNNDDFYEVHIEYCMHMPSGYFRRLLGDFHSCKAALKEAKRLGYIKANGCLWCCGASHEPKL